MQIDRVSFRAPMQRPRAAASLPSDPVDCVVHSQSRPVWREVPRVGPLPGPLAPAIADVMRELEQCGVTFQARKKPWFRPERVVDLKPQEAARRFRKGQEVLQAGVPLALTDLGQLDQLYTGRGCALPRPPLAAALKGLQDSGFQFESDLLTAYRNLEKGSPSVRVSSQDGRWKGYTLGQDGALALNALEGTRDRSLVAQPELLTAAEQLQGKFQLYACEPGANPVLGAYLALRSHSLMLQQDRFSPPVLVDRKSVQDPGPRVEEGTRLARQHLPDSSVHDQARFLRSVYELAERGRSLTPELAAACLIEAPRGSWESHQYRLERLSRELPLTPEVAAGFLKAPQKPDPMLYLEFGVGTLAERHELFSDLAAQNKLGAYLDALPQDDRVAAFRHLVLGQGSVADPELAGGLKALQEFTFLAANPDGGDPYFASRDRSLERVGIYLANPSGRVLVRAGWDQPDFPVPAAWLRTPDKVRERALEAGELAQGELACENRALRQQLFNAVYGNHDTPAPVAAPVVKNLSVLEGEETLSVWRALGEDVERVQAWIVLRDGRTPEDARALMRLLAVSLQDESLQDRVALLGRGSAEDYIRNASQRYGVDPRRLTEVWLLGEHGAAANGIAQEGRTLTVGGVRLKVAQNARGSHCPTA